MESFEFARWWVGGPEAAALRYRRTDWGEHASGDPMVRTGAPATRLLPFRLTLPCY